MRKLLAAFALWAVTALPAPAQRGVEDSRAPAVNPQLFALDRGVDDERSRRPLDLQRLDVQVRLAGSLAETEVTAQFGNPSGSPVEGRFSFQLPAHSTVSGYALDVGGQMIEGVLVEQPKAREAYTDKVRRGVDPGLGEVSRAGVFTTRVFPIFPGSGRTIRLRFVTPVDAEEGYRLPLATAEPVTQFEMAVSVVGGTATLPRISGPGVELTGTGSRVGAMGIREKLTGALQIAPVRPAAPITLTSHEGGERFFLLDDAAPATAARARPQRMRVYWDRSRSRRDHRLSDELALLRRAIDELEPAAVDLVLFGSDAPRVVTVRNAREAEAALERVTYRGATSFERLSAVRAAPADLCLLFSDGIATVDRRDPLRPGCTLHAVTTAANADMAWLRGVAAATGGEAFQLGEDRRAVLARLARPGASIAEITDASGAPVSFSVLDSGPGRVRAVGRAPTSGELRIRFAGENGFRSYAPPSTGEPTHDAAGTLWTAAQVALVAGDPAQLPVMKDLARRYGVAGPDMAYIVLETPYDYAQDDIAPPASYPKPLRAAYDRTRAQMDAAKTADRVRWTAELADTWAEQKRWWAGYNPRPRRRDQMRIQTMPVMAAPEEGIVVTGSRIARPDATQDSMAAGPPPPVSPAPLARFPVRAERQSARVARRPSSVAPPPPAEPLPPPPPPPPPPVSMPPPPPGAFKPEAGVEEADEVVLTGNRIGDQRRPRVSPGMSAFRRPELPGVAETRIEVARAGLDRPYLRALDAAGAEWSAAFAREERAHGGRPAFYLDVSDWLWRRNLRADAVEVLLSALDAPQANNETIAIVAGRLSRWGEHDRAVGLFERLHAFETHRPQPARSLAAALAARAAVRSGGLARADYDRALQLLEEVIETRPAPDYQGLEMVALMDANRLLPRYKRVGGTREPLDPRLVALLDVDMRVLLEWNAGNNDLDLHIAEPSGQTANYGRRATRIGGRVSDDMTAGYGPEEYLLRHAPDGEYRVMTNAYAADRIDPNGVPTATARLIRDWGRPSEREEVVDVELRPDDRGMKGLGRLVVARR